MTEPFPFGGVEDEAPVAYVEPAKDNRKTVAIGVLTAVVFGAGTFFFLGGGGGDGTDEAFLVPTRSPRVTAARAPVTKPVVALPAASKIQLGRNPFRALYVAPAAAVAAPAGDTSAPTITTVTPVVAPVSAPAPIVVVSGPVAQPAPVSQPPTTSTTTTTTAPAPAPAPAPKPAPAQSTVTLQSVSTKSGKAVATFVMDGKTYSGSDGAVLGGKLLIKRIAQESVEPTKWYAVLQLGDGSPFEVHEHQEVVVQ